MYNTRQDITKDIARELRTENQNLRWRRVPYNKKCEIVVQVNAQLVEQGIPAVEIELVGWRIIKVLGNLKYFDGVCAYYFLQ